MNLEKVAMKNGEVAAQTAQKIEYYGGERYAPDVMRSTIWHVQCAYEICAENQISSSPFSCVAVILGRTPENASNTDMSKWWRKSSLTYNQHITPSSALTNSPTPVTGYVVGCASVCTYWFRSTWI